MTCFGQILKLRQQKESKVSAHVTASVQIIQWACVCIHTKKAKILWKPFCVSISLRWPIGADIKSFIKIMNIAQQAVIYRKSGHRRHWEKTRCLITIHNELYEVKSFIVSLYFDLFYSFGKISFEKTGSFKRWSSRTWLKPMCYISHEVSQARVSARVWKAETSVAPWRSKILR